MSYALSRFARFIPRLARGFGRIVRRSPFGLFRRRRMRSRMIRRKKVVNKVHRYVRWATTDTTYPDSTGPNTIVSQSTAQNLAYSFKLDNVVNVADFTNLYDSYRINKVTLYLERLWNQTGNVSAPFNNKISVVHDYTDNNTLMNEEDYLEYSNCKRYNIVGNGTIRIVLYPKINNIVENVGGGANAYTSMNSNRVWLNTDDTQVPHFGIKIFVPTGAVPDDTWLFRVRAKFSISFKNSK